MSSALVPASAHWLPVAVGAKGARIFDSSGLDYIDASSGPLAVTLGHGHPKALAAIVDQFNAVDYVHRTQFRNSAAERLAGLVTERLGGGFGHALFVSSGSEANEIAMKFAHMYWAAGDCRTGTGSFLGGVALSRRVWDQVSGVYPAMTAGHTFTNAPLDCAAGIATIEALEEERVLDRVAGRGAWLGSRLLGLQADFPFVGDVRGAGYLWGVDSPPVPRPMSRQNRRWTSPPGRSPPRRPAG